MLPEDSDHILNHATNKWIDHRHRNLLSRDGKTYCCEFKKKELKLSSNATRKTQ